jgi:hypothetical protein
VLLSVVFGDRTLEMHRIIALAICAFVVGCSAEKPGVHPSDRSWTTGTITITPTQHDRELGIDVKGHWPDCSEGLWIRYELWLAQSGSLDVFLIGSANQLATFQQVGTGVTDYSEGSFTRIDQTHPYRAVFDYEIWKGEPTKGELLAKNSVSSFEIAPRWPK